MNTSRDSETAPARKAPPRPTASKRSPLDKFSFFLIFVFGALGIVFLKTYFDLDPRYVAIWPVSLMLLYWALTGLSPRYRLRLDQVGDNLYYLGFLYTLVSLAVALYYFTDQEQALDQIIANFGIALSTTILGVALRVVMHQMREDPLDTEREARVSLAEASNQLRAELNSTVAQFNSFSRQIRQSVEEGLEEVGASASKVLSTSSKAVAEAASTAHEGIEESFRNFAEHSKELSAASQRQVKATEKLTKRLEAIEVPQDLIERKLGPAIDRLSALAEKIDERHRLDEERLGRLSEAVDAMSKAAEAMNGQAEAMQHKLEALDQFPLKMEAVVGEIGRLHEVLDSSGKAVARFGEVQTNAADAHAELLREQVKALEHQQHAVAEQMESFREGLRELREAGAKESREAMAAHLQAQKEAHDRFARDVEESIVALKKARAASEEEAERARKASAEVLRHLTDMMRTLSHQLGATETDTRVTGTDRQHG